VNGNRQFFPIGGAFPAFSTPGFRVLRITGKPAIFNDFNIWQQGSKRSGSSGFGSSAFSPDQNTANARFNSI
jgi:hypothetical protein